MSQNGKTRSPGKDESIATAPSYFCSSAPLRIVDLGSRHLSAVAAVAAVAAALRDTDGVVVYSAPGWWFTAPRGGGLRRPGGGGLRRTGGVVYDPP